MEFGVIATSSGDVLVTYDSGVAAVAGAAGAANPTSQSWVQSGTLASYDSGDGGWRTVDSVTTQLVFFTKSLSVQQSSTLAAANYWRASWTLALDSSAILASGSTQTDWYLSPNNSRQNNIFLNVQLDNNFNFGLGMYLDANNQVQIGSGTNRYDTGVFVGGTNAFPKFRTYTLTYDKALGAATLDYGAGTVSIPKGTDPNASRVQFGTASSLGTGSAIWNDITLETLLIVPEPLSLGYHGVGFAVLMFLVRPDGPRRKRTRFPPRVGFLAQPGRGCAGPVGK